MKNFVHLLVGIPSKGDKPFTFYVLTMNVLRWGLLGTARINRRLIPPIRASKRNEVVAVASREAARAQAYAQQWNIARAYGSYEALLDDPDIDVVYNPLPNHLHAAWTIKAARAGKHVLCEKPLALSVEEVDAIETAAREAGVVVMKLSCISITRER